MDTDTLGDAYVWNWTIPDEQYQKMVAAAVAERDSATNKGKYGRLPTNFNGHLCLNRMGKEPATG